MERRKFFSTGIKGAMAASLFPFVGDLTAQPSTRIIFDEAGNPVGEKITNPIRKKTLNVDVVVIGAGMAGISAAVSAARNGAKVVLVQDRPVLGGNASSEMRVTVNGVQGLKNKHKVERETGIIEELLIENWYYNPQESYPVWDHVLYNYVVREKNITLFLNTSAMNVVMDGTK